MEWGGTGWDLNSFRPKAFHDFLLQEFCCPESRARPPPQGRSVGFDPCERSLPILAWKALDAPRPSPRSAGSVGMEPKALPRNVGFVGSRQWKRRRESLEPEEEESRSGIRSHQWKETGMLGKKKKKKKEGKNNQKAQTCPGLVEKLHTKRAFLGKKDKALPLLEFRDTDVSFLGIVYTWTPGRERNSQKRLRER